jgi:hypothetical protein
MQDGFITDTTHGPAIHAVQPGGGESGDAVYKGAEVGDGTGSTLDRKESPDGKRGHQRSDPRVVDGHRWPNPRTAGMILRVSPRQTGWAPWPEVGAVFREYQMGQAQTLSAAQRTVGRGGLIIGARCVSFRLALRPGRTVSGSTPLSCPRHPAQVAVLVSTQPSTGPPRYWSEKDPQGGLLQRPEEADPGAGSTRTTTQQSQPTAHGPRGTGTTVDPRRSGGEEASSTIPIAVPSTLVPGPTSGVVSTPDAPQNPVGQAGGRPHIISSSSSSSGGRGLAFQKPFMISGQGIWFDCSVFLAIMFAVCGKI